MAVCARPGGEAAVKILLAFVTLIALTACGSGGPPPPDWKTDAADLIERYKKHALLGENTLAERYFQQAVLATGGAGRVADTARLWLVRCATRRAMLIDDACTEYADLAKIESTPADRAYYQFLSLRWESIDAAQLPEHHRGLVSATPGTRPTLLAKVDDPLARLIDASLLVMRQEADAATLTIAADTASSQGWKQPLLTYLKLQESQASAQGNAADQLRLSRRIQMVEESLSSAHK
jgi:predicted small lipoprotein YifL